MRIPVATYRLQFNRDFRFTDARALVPFLHELGVTDLYSSPLFTARRGSTHGYDVTDPSHLNPELGSEEDFERLVEELQRHGMGLLLDIVPNHMAASPENPWWVDVLENGATSPYAGYFNMEWHPVVAHGGRENKVLLPVLGRPYGYALENQELTLGLDQNGFFVGYCGLRLPLDPRSYHTILSYRLERLTPPPELLDVLRSIECLPARTATEPQAMEQRWRDREILKQRIWNLYRTDPRVKNFIDENLRSFNGVKGDAASFDLLDRVLDDQPYRPAFWRLATERINYWRFFDITDLVGIRSDDPDVFRATHTLVCRWGNQEKVTGVRVDHIDGLYDPLGYLQRLQSCVSSYVVVEKILLGDETLPEQWPVSGTTGYDFLNAVNGLFVDARGLEALDAIYAQFTGSRNSFTETVYQEKKRVIRDLFRGELRVLWNELGALAEQDRHARDSSPKELVEALLEVTACLPVYRTYARDFFVEPRDRSYIEQAIDEASRRNPHISSPIFDFLRRVLLLDFAASTPEEQREGWLRFLMRWQQFTGPVTAKGVEDTALYVYNRLVSLNEVGGSCRPVSVEAFHQFNRLRQQRWPLTMNATSTHDSKRSEDVRARINVLSEIPGPWDHAVRRWSRWNRAKKRVIDGRPVPDANEEILLYQTLLGAWPLAVEEMPGFAPRVKDYMRKAAREAKVNTSWIHPNEAYEQALQEFVDAVLDPSVENRFYADLLRFQRMVAFYGAISSLGQVLLKIASPGVPDFYQGCAAWNLCLVDPDNRRPIDSTGARQELNRLKETTGKDLVPTVRELLAHWEDSRAKLFLTCKALNFRRAQQELFTRGDYLPLPASGRREEHVVAFARRWGGRWAVAVAPRLLAKFSAPETPPLGRRRWDDTVLQLPEDAPVSWMNVLTGESLKGRVLPLHSVLHHFPVALLWGTVPGISERPA